MKKFASAFVFLFTVCIIFSALGCSNSAGGGGSSGGGQNTSGTTVTITINSNPTNITYNLNGGAGGSGEFNICTDSNGTLNSSITKEGYTFGGWYTTPDFSTSPITKITEDTTLYAKWTPITYKVVFNANGASGTMSQQTFTYGVAQPLTEKAFTKTGYNFAGWAKSQTGSAEYTDKQSVKNLASTNNATVTLYAVWVVEGSYSITYNLNGGTNAAANPGTYNVETATITLAAPTKTGHTFGGWYKEDSFATKVTQIAKGSTGNITLYAKWEAITITLTLNLDGGSGTKTLSGKYGTAVTAPTAPTKSGYEFTGWTPPLPATFTADATYTAQWNAVATEINGPLNQDNADEILTPLNGADWRTKESIVIPNGVTSIEIDVFSTLNNNGFRQKNAYLKSVIIPNTVTSIGEGAFSACSSLNSVTIPSSVTSIGRGAFIGCSNLASVTIPDSVTFIGEVAFRLCSNLSSIILPNGITFIGYATFDGCKKLANITIPSSVTSICFDAFCGCDSLESVEFADKSGWAKYSYNKTYIKKDDINVNDASTNASELKAPLSIEDAWVNFYLLKGGTPVPDPFAH